jgi:hypothetical protein
MGGWVGDHAQMHGLHGDAMELNVFFCAHSLTPPDGTHACGCTTTTTTTTTTATTTTTR